MHGISINKLLVPNATSKWKMSLNRNHVRCHKNSHKDTLRVMLVNFESAEAEHPEATEQKQVIKHNTCHYNQETTRGCVELELLYLYLFFMQEGKVENQYKQHEERMHWLMMNYVEMQHPRVTKR